MVVTRRPVEMFFGFGAPIIVIDVSGHAAELGIQEGWRLTAYAGKAVPENFNDFYADWKRFVGAPVIDCKIDNRTVSLVKADVR